jgi:hypothetical protein
MLDSHAAKLAPLLTLAVAATTLVPTIAKAAPAPPPTRVAVLGPSDTSILPRLQRNVASMKFDTLHATVTLCSRDVITRLMGELQADMAICTDGDQIGVWVRDGERLVLKEAVVVQSADDRAQELAAARAVMALAKVPAKEAAPERAPPRAFTIVASGPSSPIAPSVEPNAPPIAPASAKDAPSTPTPSPALPRYAPRLVLGVGPALAASHHGNSLAISAGAEVGVSRYVALVPWVQVVPANRTAEAPLGTATFRPTIFGLGFAIPLARTSSPVVPRIGLGYGMLWMHVSPETSVAPGAMRKPEDLLAPLVYATTVVSVKVAESFRVAGEGMLGVSSHDMVVRIGNESAAHWGVPLASLALRGEWVVQ